MSAAAVVGGRQTDAFDELRRVANVLDYTRQTERLMACSAEEMLKLVRACWASDWDVYPDALSHEQIDAILTGALDKPDFVETWRGLEPVAP